MEIGKKYFKHNSEIEFFIFIYDERIIKVVFVLNLCYFLSVLIFLKIFYFCKQLIQCLYYQITFTSYFIINASWKYLYKLKMMPWSSKPHLHDEKNYFLQEDKTEILLLSIILFKNYEEDNFLILIQSYTQINCKIINIEKK